MLHGNPKILTSIDDGGDAGSLVSSMIGFEAFSVASVLVMASLEVVGVALC